MKAIERESFWFVVGFVAVLILVVLGTVAIAAADVTPVIMPTKPTVPSMQIGQTIKSGPASTTLETASFAPSVTAVQFGGELTQ